MEPTSDLSLKIIVEPSLLTARSASNILVSDFGCGLSRGTLAIESASSWELAGSLTPVVLVIPPSLTSVGVCRLTALGDLDVDSGLEITTPVPSAAAASIAIIKVVATPVELISVPWASWLEWNQVASGWVNGPLSKTGVEIFDKPFASAFDVSVFSRHWAGSNEATENSSGNNRELHCFDAEKDCDFI